MVAAVALAAVVGRPEEAAVVGQIEVAAVVGWLGVAVVVGRLGVAAVVGRPETEDLVASEDAWMPWRGVEAAGRAMRGTAMWTQEGAPTAAL